MNKYNKVKFSTKAVTLAMLKDINFSFSIPPLVYFTIAEWTQSHSKITKLIEEKFKHVVAVRSSSSAEDTSNESMAGAFTSILDVNIKNENEIIQAVNKVIKSYGESANIDTDHILIQEMAQDITLSGVVMTRVLDTGAPYYVINYDDESGRTDTITSGAGVNKTILIYHDTKKEHFTSPRLYKILQFVQELENFFVGEHLDIEFGVNNDGVISLFQVRPIAAAKNWRQDLVSKVERAGGVTLLSSSDSNQHHKHMEHIEQFFEYYTKPRPEIFGERAVLSNMGDWNPAEMIGADPSPLAASLYRYLITSEAWSIARAKMGYQVLPKSDLMVLLSGSPYIDLRLSFNSFLPNNISPAIGEKLVNAWLNRVAENPSLHDKVEFEVSQTIFDFDFETILESRYPNLLNKDEVNELSARLHTLTLNAIDFSESSSLKQALYEIEGLNTRQQPKYLIPPKSNPVQLASWLRVILSDCIRYGTLPFSTVARHGFIAEALMRSAIRMGAISPKRVEEYKGSFTTVLGELTEDSKSLDEGRLSKEEFLQRYGHLRPGTYDIMSHSYKEMPDILSKSIPQDKAERNLFQLTQTERKNLTNLFTFSGFKKINADNFLSYFKFAIQAREYGKFTFTRSLSAALEGIVEWGKHWSMSREDLSYLSIENIMASAYTSSQDLFSRSLTRQIEFAKIEREFNRKTKLGSVIRNSGDLYIVPLQSAEPNFVGDKRVEAECQILTGTDSTDSLTGKIICIQSADPGYDFIFAKGIAGLITQYGGANSHMAIRCSEIGLPAAIGCGENVFLSLTTGSRVGLYCDEKSIRIL